MKLIYSYICGDILHSGHILHLENSKSLRDKLIVGILTDSAIIKHKPRPIIPFYQRLELVSKLSFVDCVVPQKEYSPLKNVLMINPDILMESESHIGKEYLRELKRQFKGRIVFMPYFPEVSSTKIKKKIKNGKKS